MSNNSFEFDSRGLTNTVVVILSLVCGILSISAGYLVGQNYINSIYPENEEGVILTHEKPTPTPSSTITPAIKADWKTYKNDKYNYSFRYPSEWVITEICDKADLAIWQSASEKNTMAADFSSCPMAGSLISADFDRANYFFTVHQGEKKQLGRAALLEMLKSNVGWENVKLVESITVDGVEDNYNQADIYTYAGMTGYASIIWTVLNLGYQMNWIDSSDELMETMKKVVSTFQYPTQ